MASNTCSSKKLKATLKGIGQLVNETLHEMEDSPVLTHKGKL